MNEEETPNQYKSLGPSEKLVDGAVHDTTEYMFKSLGAFLLSLLSLALTGFGWLFKGLSICFAKLSVWSFLGAGKLVIVAKRIRWHEKDKDEE